MGKFADVVKRLLNVAVILCTLLSVFLALVVIIGGVSNWVEFVSSNIFPIIIAYAVVVGLNYILYGRLTLWHKV